MSHSREFTYKGKNVKVIATPTARGKHLGIPEIDGVDLSGRGIGSESDTVKEALDAGEEVAKSIIDGEK